MQLFVSVVDVAVELRIRNRTILLNTIPQIQVQTLKCLVTCGVSQIGAAKVDFKWGDV